MSTCKLLATWLRSSPILYAISELLIPVKLLPFSASMINRGRNWDFEIFITPPKRISLISDLIPPVFLLVGTFPHPIIGNKEISRINLCRKYRRSLELFFYCLFHLQSLT